MFGGKVLAVLAVKCVQDRGKDLIIRSWWSVHIDIASGRRRDGSLKNGGE